MQAARNHQMKHQPQVAFHTNRDALSDSPYSFHRTTFDPCEWRLNSAQKKYARKTHLFERLAENPLFKRGNISGDVWKLRHCNQSAIVTRPVARAIFRRFN